MKGVTCDKLIYDSDISPHKRTNYLIHIEATEVNSI